MAAVCTGLLFLHLPPTLVGIITVSVGMLLTGGLHEDGLADTADGFGGGRGQSRKLHIMRDSRVGTYGVLVLIASSSVRMTLLAHLVGQFSDMWVIIMAAVVARASMLIQLSILTAARTDGASGMLELAPKWAIYTGIAMATAGLFISLMGVILAIVGVVCFAVLCKRHIDGFTGDTMGASCVIAECLFLFGAAATL